MVSSDLSKLRIDHIGSLVRPAKLKEAFARHDRKQAAPQELEKAQDDAIREVIQKQEEHGLPVVTDGEFRRHNFQESFSECVTGFDVPYPSGMAQSRWVESSSTRITESCLPPGIRVGEYSLSGVVVTATELLLAKS